MTVTDILTEWLKANGYDGLVADDAECGCELKDLAPCSGPWDTCRPGYRGPDPENEGGWAMYPTKQAAEEAKAEQK